MKIELEEESLERYGDSLKRGIHTSSPAYIDTYDPERRVCSIKIPISEFIETDGDEPINQDWQVIPDCPVWYLGGGGFVGAFPLKKGEPCLAIFCQRPIDEWWASDGVTDVTPELVDTHTESDVIVLAGRLFPQGAIKGDANATDFILSHEDDKVGMIIKPGGEVQIKAEHVRLGAFDGAIPLALGDKTDTRLTMLAGKIDGLIQGAAAAVAAGGLWLTPPPAPVGAVATVGSITVMANS